MELRNQIRQKLHGREIIEIVDDGTYDHNGRVESFGNTLKSVENFVNRNVLSLFSETAVLRFAADKTAFRFGRMFNKTEQDFDSDVLKDLGKAMIQPSNLDPPDDSKNPAGYTFLGQFIAHDLSFDENASDFPDELIESDDELKSKRTPTLELDSLYGLLFDKDGNEFFNPALYKDKSRFRIDLTVKENPSLHDDKLVLPNDLPRKDQIALIGDPRNDENLAIAQTHVAFLRFHNAVVDDLEQKNLVAEDDLFKTARMIVIKYYQAIILHDFLPKIVDENILKDVIEWAKAVDKKDRKITWLKDGEEPFVPIEFSAAAFRFGHSQLQDAYEWNNIFQSSNGENGTFRNLFLFTGRGRLGGFPTPPNRFENLLGSWMIDWRRFFKYNFRALRGDTGRRPERGRNKQFRCRTSRQSHPYGRICLGRFHEQ